MARTLERMKKEESRELNRKYVREGQIEEKYQEYLKQKEELKNIAKTLEWLKSKIMKIKKDLATKQGHLEATLEWSRKIFKGSEESDIQFALGYMSKANDSITRALQELGKALEHINLAISFRNNDRDVITFIVYNNCMKDVPNNISHAEYEKRSKICYDKAIKVYEKMKRKKIIL